MAAFLSNRPSPCDVCDVKQNNNKITPRPKKQIKQKLEIEVVSLTMVFNKGNIRKKQ